MPVIALVDCNNFYVSCERVFEPSLENRAVAVLSNNDGCLVARSNEVKNAGIPMGAPFFKFKDELKKIDCKVFSSNYSLYGDMSGRVMKILSEYCEEIEVYSIDEAFLDLTGIPENELLDYCQNLKNYIKKCTGIPVSFGLAETKTLAKLANNLAKIDMRKGKKLYNDVFSFIGMNIEQRNAVFESVKVGELWGIGRQGAKKLESNGVLNVLQLINKDLDWVKKLLTIQGARLVQELKGVKCHQLELFVNDKKSIASTRSFGKSITSIIELKEAVAMYATRIGEKLRKGGQMTNFLQVFVMSDRFKENYRFVSSNVKLVNPTSYTPELVKIAINEIDKLYERGISYKKAGIMAFDLQSDKNIEVPLFDDKKFSTDKEKDIMQTIDNINKKFGKMTVRSARVGFKEVWQMKQNLNSPRYTTSWKELLNID
jgi:DNA polymerase V